MVAAAGATPVIGDIEEIATLTSIATDADATVFAPQLPSQELEQSTVQALLSAYTGTDKALVFTSGTGVLGQRTNGEWSEDTFSEFDPIVPSKFIRTRYITEQLVQTAGQFDCRAMVIRPPNIWSEEQHMFAQAMADSGRKTGAVCYIGSGLSLYSHVHVRDLAVLYRLALEKGTGGALYHAVAGEINNRFIAELVAMRMKLKTRSVDMSEAIALWGKFDALVVLSVCSRSRSPRARQDLGWKPEITDLPSVLLENDYNFFVD